LVFVNHATAVKDDLRLLLGSPSSLSSSSLNEHFSNNPPTLRLLTETILLRKTTPKAKKTLCDFLLAKAHLFTTEDAVLIIEIVISKVPEGEFLAVFAGNCDRTSTNGEVSVIASMDDYKLSIVSPAGLFFFFFILN